MVKQKTNKVIAVMLVLAVMLTSLIAGAMLLAPKTSEVNAYEPGSSATLAGYGSQGNHESDCWYGNLGSTGVTQANIVNLTITTTASKIVGYETGTDVSEARDGSLYYYYKANETDSTQYDVVIYADVETIYAPVNCVELFRALSNCKTITFENFNTINVTDMSYMFLGCLSLTSLDLTSFNTGNVTNMLSMFDGCKSLTSLDVSNFNTSKVTSMYRMFLGCSSLTSLDVSNFIMVEGVETVTMIANLPNLQTFVVPNNMGSAVIETDINSYYLVDSNNILVQQITSAYSGQTLTTTLTPTINEDDLYKGPENPGSVALDNIANWKDTLSSAGITGDMIESFVVTSDASKLEGFTKTDFGDITIYYKNAGTYGKMGLKYPGDAGKLTQLYDIVIYSQANIIAPENCNSLFMICGGGYQNASNVKKIVIENLDTSNVTDMGMMFYNNTHLKHLDIRNIDTSNVTGMMGYMGPASMIFGGCTALEYLNISNFDLTNCQSEAPYLFSGLTNLKEVHLPKTIGAAEIAFDEGVNLYVNGEGTVVNPVTSAHNGTILTKQGVEPILPPDVGEIDPDTPESGVTLIDLLILTMLTLVLSGVCVIILKNKNKSLNKR